jgi:hypothetical protein
MNLTLGNILPLLYLLGAIGLDTAAGIAVAVRAGVFRWTKLPQYVETTVHPFISPVAVLTVVTGFLNGEQSFATPALNAALVAMALSYTPRFLADAKDKWLAYAAGTMVRPKAG